MSAVCLVQVPLNDYDPNQDRRPSAEWLHLSLAIGSENQVEGHSEPRIAVIKWLDEKE